MEAYGSSPELVMCIGVCYTVNHKITIAHFTHSAAYLPIQHKNADKISLIKWGRRKIEKSFFPLGGWATTESIKNGKWDKYFPKFVKVKINKFLEIDFEGQPQWFDVTEGQYIQGLYVQENTEQRIYIVTIVPELDNTTYTRWPKIIAL